MKITPAVVAVALPLVLVGGIATAAEAQHARVTHACASNATGVLRAAQHCAKGEHRVELGAAQPTGISGVHMVVGRLIAPSTGPIAVDATCAPGEKVLGGGGNAAQYDSQGAPEGNPDDARLMASSPLSASSWRATLYVPLGLMVEAWAICAPAS